MEEIISRKISAISPSSTLAITARVKQMKQQGIDVVNLGAGEPDFDTPYYIKEEAKKAIDEGFTKYTPVSGIKELKEAIGKKFKKDNNLDYSCEEILISCGAKHAIFNAILTLCNEGDEVILPSPYWVSYREMIKIAGAKPVIIKTTYEDDFKISPQQLQEAITPKTKLLILNTPSNPTGMVYTKDELLSLSNILVEKGIFCLSDEVYEKIIYDGEKHVSIASLGSKIKELTIVVNGVSKSYSMTGWRIGYAGGPKKIIQAMSNLQSHSTSNPTSISQKAALAALEGCQKAVEGMVKDFRERRDYIVERINSLRKLFCVKPKGAFYVFANISALLGRRFKDKVINDGLNFSQFLLEEAKAAVIPGNSFGDSSYIRISYATSLENLRKGMERIEMFLDKIS
ncbi:MAG: aspartate aminotransferase [Candidatus Omnitrophica bacterium 4484_70.1]|nr:MAG: aspartate aminotransferase [Candidatus Omnitrophica bacterium 4484_70.1]